MSEWTRQEAATIATEMNTGHRQDAMIRATNDIWGLRSQGPGGAHQEHELREALHSMGYGVQQQNLLAADRQYHTYFVPYQERPGMAPYPQGGVMQGPCVGVDIRLPGVDINAGCNGTYVAPMLEIFGGRGHERRDEDHDRNRRR